MKIETLAIHAGYSPDPTTKAVLGAIGVSGLSSQEDEDLARLGMTNLGL